MTIIIILVVHLYEDYAHICRLSFAPLLYTSADIEEARA